MGPSIYAADEYVTTREPFIDVVVVNADGDDLLFRDALAVQRAFVPLACTSGATRSDNSDFKASSRSKFQLSLLLNASRRFQKLNEG